MRARAWYASNETYLLNLTSLSIFLILLLLLLQLDVHSSYEVSATEANMVALHKSDEITASFKVLETV